VEAGVNAGTDALVVGPPTVTTLRVTVLNSPVLGPN
jgi:hypothetical protein